MPKNRRKNNTAMVSCILNYLIQNYKREMRFISSLGVDTNQIILPFTLMMRYVVYYLVVLD